jgi:hypothetical protein
MTRIASFGSLVVAAALATPAVAHDHAADSRKSSDSRDTERVEIKRSSTWGFSNEVRNYLSDAYQSMYANPEDAANDLMIAVGMAEILAATAGSDGSELSQAIDELSRFSQKVQMGMVTNPDALSGPASKVVLGIAKLQWMEAQRGVEMGDESMVGYSLDSAAVNLLQAHIYLKKNPDEQTAQAIFNAGRLAAQVKSLIEPTTQQGAKFAVTIPEEQGDVEDIRLLEGGDEYDQAQLASGETNGQKDKVNVADQIPMIAPDVVKALGDAIKEAQEATASGDD